METKTLENFEPKIVEAAIKSAENNTSGEIKVHIEASCTENVMHRAAQVFSLLKLDQTADRNGVLFYLSYQDHKFAILGDSGINAVVKADFWDNIKVVMQTQFKNGNFTQGLCRGIEMAGIQLKDKFPYKSNDINELSDEISFGDI